MENLLPFLLGLLFLGIKYYNKTQKDKAKKLLEHGGSIERPSPKASSLDDFIEQFYPQKTTPFTEPAYVGNVEKEEEKLSWMEQKHQEEPESIEYIDNTTGKIKHETQFEMIQNKPNQATEKLDFDLKKAIVYDAIMNPPYL